MIFNPKHHSRYIAIAAAGLFCVTLIAWNHEPVYQVGDTTFYQDTVPVQRDKSSGIHDKTSELRDLDLELEKLDRAIETLENLQTKDCDHLSEKIQEQLNRINIDEMINKINVEEVINKVNIEEMISKINFGELINKINVGELNNKVNIEEVIKQAELAMKTVDLNNINIEAQKALMAIDVEVVQKQVNEAMASVKYDTDAIQKVMTEVKIELNKELAELKDLNTVEINEAMDAVKVELKKAREELKAGNEELKAEYKDFNKELENAKTDIQEAKKEIRGYQDMIYSMEKEGLIDTKNDYKIGYRDGSIYINDKKQTDAVTAKYRKHLKNDITIIKENGRFNIDSKQSKVD